MLVPELERVPHHTAENEIRDAVLRQVAAVKSEMEQTQALLREQSKECLRLYSKLNSLSPIDRLPAEIKTEIFHNALLPVSNLKNFHTSTGRGGDPPVTPFSLGKICKGWRNFVWSSPLLWTNIHLCLSKRRYESQTTLLREWLSRTAGCALSFHLTAVASEALQTWILDPPKEILVAFASVSTQWKEIEFFIPDNKDCLDAIFGAKIPLPLLTTATVRLLGSAEEKKIDLFSMAPQLSALHLYPTFYLDMVTAPWHQLREFSHSESSTVDEIHAFLHKAPNIARCSFHNIDSELILNSRSLNPDLADRSPMLEHLEYLEFSFDSVINTRSTRILGSVKLPSLRELSLSGPFDSSWPILDSIMTSFHSSPLLEKFTLGGIISSDHDLIRILEKIPSITDLCLSFNTSRHELLTNELLQRLCPPYENILLPNLRSLTYDGPTSLNYNMHLLRDALVYRSGLGQAASHATEYSELRTSRIRSVTVITVDELVVGPDIQHDLDTLVQDGLVLSLTSTWKDRFGA